MEWPAQLNPSSWILTHLQETAKNTSPPSLFDPLTLALSILILFFKKIKNKTSINIIYLFSFYLLDNKQKQKRPLTLACLYSFSILSVFLFIYYLIDK